MPDDLRWIRVPSHMMGAGTSLFVSVVDILSYLEGDNPDEQSLADVLRNLLAADEPVPDTIPEWMADA